MLPCRQRHRRAATPDTELNNVYGAFINTWQRKAPLAWNGNENENNNNNNNNPKTVQQTHQANGTSSDQRPRRDEGPQSGDQRPAVDDADGADDAASTATGSAVGSAAGFSFGFCFSWDLSVCPSVCRWVEASASGPLGESLAYCVWNHLSLGKQLPVAT